MTRVGVIGSGFGGLAVAVELLRNGHEDVVLWERSDELGGVWRDNTYPGSGCDVPSPLYQFSFAPRRSWSRRYAPQAEIFDYLHEVAASYGVSGRIVYGRRVVRATWQEEDACWKVGFADGTTEHVEVLVSAVGQLSEPRMPGVTGLEDFTGTAFHSARWDHSWDPRGQRVAVVGTGASAIQFVPHLARDAASVSVFQRTANYILPKPDGPFPRWYHPAVSLERPFFRSAGEGFSRGLDAGSKVAKVNRAVSLAHLRRQVRDPELRARLTPDYPVGCRRILFSNNYYPALTQPHVELVSDSVTEVTATGVRTPDGVEREVDAIVFGTGFAAQDFLAGIEVTGRDGAQLSKQWSEGARAYLGVHVPGFPNLFVAYGPNTNLGGSSIIVMLEAQARHIRMVLDRMAALDHRTVEVTPAAEQVWDRDVQDRLERSAWAQCDSWYRHPVSGRITSNWPGGTRPYEERTAQLVPEAFAWA